MLRSQRLLFLLLLLLFLPKNIQAQRAVDDGDRLQLRGSVHPLARAEFDRGPADLAMPMNNMIMSLNLRPGAEPELKQFLADQQNPNSPNYHKWLTPEQFGAKFGPSEQDIADVSAWLRQQGFKIEHVGKSRMWVNFSGSVAQVERAFQTNIRNYEVRGTMHHANAVNPTIPRAFSGLVSGVVTMHDFKRAHFLSARSQLPADFTSPSTGANFLAPADFATIYDVNPLYTAGITGVGQTIAIVGRTDLQLADVQFFRSFFGLRANDPVIINNGTDPGDLGGVDETEADLDVEWSGAVAPDATIKFVVSASTTSTDGIDLSVQYVVDNNLAPVMSTSYGDCEAGMSPTELNFYSTIYAQGASQGITAFVSSGDSGASGCDAATATTGSGAAVSGLASTPYNIAVGGTQFNEGAGTYWNATDDPTTEGSAISYIPEVVWNESALNGGTGLDASGGGVSVIYAKPAFQTGPGVPSDGMRDVPDVSLSAANHDGYLIIQGHTATASGMISVGGTSAAAPSFAGLMALVVQKTGSAQGNANTVFYSMGANQQAGGTAVFHDITSGNNSVPGVTGFSAGVGYDLATGWGSVDAANLVNFWNNNAVPTPDFSMSASPSNVGVNQGSSVSSTITITPINGFNGSVTLAALGLPSGVTATFSPNPATTTSVVTFSAATNAAGIGTSTIVATGTSGSLSHNTAIVVTVNQTPNFTLSAAPASLSVTQGASGTSTITVAKSGGFNSSVTLSASGLPTGVTAAFATNPTTSTSVLTLTASSAATAGPATVTITGTSGSLTRTTTIALTVVSAAPVQLLGDPGFENNTPAPWSLTPGVLNSDADDEPPHSGIRDAWLDGYGRPHTDIAKQTVTIPATITTATLSFWLHIDTAEYTTHTAYDTLQVQVLNSTGSTVLATLATFSNLNHARGYQQHSYNMIQFKGQTVIIRFIGKEDDDLQTSFVIDDTALTVQ
jgi:subtilase family serine protease